MSVRTGSVCTSHSIYTQANMISTFSTSQPMVVALHHIPSSHIARYNMLLYMAEESYLAGDLLK